MNTLIQNRLAALRQRMTESCIHYYLVPTSDFHESEYVGEHFKAREFITGFTGSAGTALIMEDQAYLWTDGRYFLQAAEQLEGTGMTLMKSGEEGVPTIKKFLKEHLKKGQTLAFDGRVVACLAGLEFKKMTDAVGAHLETDVDLINDIWDDRPSMAQNPVFILEEKYAGESLTSKIGRIREEMKKAGAAYHLMATLDDICWTLNVRGSDIEYMPLVLSYMMLTPSENVLYIDDSRLDDKVLVYLKENEITLKPYNDVYDDLAKLGEHDTDSTDTTDASLDADSEKQPSVAPAASDKCTILIDPSRLNYSLFGHIPASVKIKKAINPAFLMKCIRNETEISNLRKAQIMDSVCHIRFMKWLKENVGKQTISEIDASDKLDEFRAQWPTFIYPSFAPISAFGAHGAIIHYEATKATEWTLEEGKLFLTDTGASFYEGTTDITRTYALRQVPRLMKEHFTTGCIAHLRLADATFKKGCPGAVLDMMARGPLWKKGLDFNHGTGHGLGFLLNVHEGPGRITYRTSRTESDEVKEGMVLTDEPGVYVAGSHGIRLENDLLVVKGDKTDFGQFLHFETLTFVPFDLDAILPEEMEASDRELLNRYHKAVYEKTAPYLNEEEKTFLRYYTREI
ncbi:MAG: aminopeptidase P family N-terminal domain-containing protein [Lachnospiraceae bacterium]|nr:aminopeptidase P family N-terminal domain-containing protein [Candidatus Equihabitans merdae]